MIFSALLSKLIPRYALGSAILPFCLYNRHRTAFNHCSGGVAPSHSFWMKTVRTFRPVGQFCQNSVGIVPETLLPLAAFFNAHTISASSGLPRSRSHCCNRLSWLRLSEQMRQAVFSLSLFPVTSSGFDSLPRRLEKNLTQTSLSIPSSLCSF